MKIIIKFANLYLRKTLIEDDSLSINEIAKKNNLEFKGKCFLDGSPFPEAMMDGPIRNYVKADHCQISDVVKILP